MSEIQYILEASKGKASRSLTPAPEKLSQLLMLANIVPPDVELPDLEAKVNWDTSVFFIDTVIRKALDEILDGLPELFRLYVGLGEDRILELFEPPKPRFSARSYEDTEENETDLENDDESDDEAEREKVLEKINSNVYVWAMRYQIFRESREMLRRIARSVSQEEKRIGDVREKRLLPASYSIEIDEGGHLKLVPPFYINWLDGIEAARIRECEVCTRLFRAGRLDQHTCSLKCAKILRTRRWRAKYQSDYKQQRIQRENEREAAAKNDTTSENKKRR